MIERTTIVHRGTAGGQDEETSAVKFAKKRSTICVDFRASSSDRFAASVLRLAISSLMAGAKNLPVFGDVFGDVAPAFPSFQRVGKLGATSYVRLSICDSVAESRAATACHPSDGGLLISVSRSGLRNDLASGSVRGRARSRRA